MKPNLLIATMAILLASTCSEYKSPTYSNKRPDPFPSGGAAAVITSIVPDKGFAGDEVIINGSGFRPDTVETMVNVGIRAARILSITDTQIRIKMPINLSGPKRVRVAVLGAEKWSNELSYNYLNDFLLFNHTIQNPVGVAVDNAGNLYIGSSSENRIYKLDAVDSVYSVFASLAQVRGPMEFGPNGDLYFVSLTGIDKVSPAGAVSPVLVQATVQDFDWAENGDLYFITLTTPRVRRWNGTTNTEVATVVQPRRIRIYNGEVYVTEFTQLRVSKFPINPNGSLGTRVTAFQSNTAIQGVEFDARGNIYVSGYVRDYLFKAPPNRANDGVFTEIPTPKDRENPFRRITTNIGEIKIERSVIYLTQVVPNGQVGKIWRIFINEHPAPRHGRD